MSIDLTFTTDPTGYFRRALARPGLSAFCFAYRQYYLPEQPLIELAAMVLVTDDAAFLLLSDKSDDIEQWLEHTGTAAVLNTVQALSARLGAPLLNVSQAIRLEPVSIAKPWGQEVWYTGIESRGQAGVSDGSHHLSLPWLLGIAPDLWLGTDDKAPNLLKILDPLPEAVYGDLYFELHEEKREVYVVTHIDPTAWPDGRGAIRFGFHPAKRAEYSGDEAFRQAFASAVADYEKVRRDIDNRIDVFRQQDGVAINEPVSAQVLKGWMAKIPEALQAEELRLRERMNSFTAMVPLQVGDVVKVPCFTPHALQHGVRTIEFQTPVYERRILSFAQKVLTQSHWDTAEAVAMMHLEPGCIESLPVLDQCEHYTLEQVVRFDDFEVQRLTLKAGHSWHSAATGQYKLAIVVCGNGRVGGVDLKPEQAVLVPAILSELRVGADAAGDLTLLIALPRSTPTHPA